MTATDFDDRPSDAGEHMLRSAQQRELVLDVVQRFDRPLPLSVLVAAIVDESEPATDPVDRGTRLADELRIRLHHVHLPKLSRTGAIEYDAASRTLEPLSG